jgi:hypothetical protein
MPEKCEPCPENAVCEGGDLFPKPEVGYWLDFEGSFNNSMNTPQSLEKTFFRIHPCLRETCGGVERSDECFRRSNFLLDESVGSLRISSNMSYCHDDDLQCRDGAYGKC